MNKFLEKYGFVPDTDKINHLVSRLSENLNLFYTKEVLLKCFSFMDLTTLHTDDTTSTVAALVEKVNSLSHEYPTYPLPASICAFPNFASDIVEARTDPELHATVVSGCFPSSQSFIEVKERECELAVKSGADEIDIVLALNLFLAGEYDNASSEIRRIKAVIDKAAEGRKVVLKVILETGLLGSAENIAEASFLAMEAGADFIKTSTGKVSVNATPASAYVMCECIRLFYAKTGRKVGFKAAGGISSAEDAVAYYAIVATVLGEEWLDKSLFRLGVSRLGNHLMSAIEQNTVNFF